MDVSGLMESVGWEYLRTNPMELKDEGMEFANQQNGFQMINPTEDWFPGKLLYYFINISKSFFV